MTPKVCLLGATGFVSKGIIAALSSEKEKSIDLVLAARNTEKLKSFLKEFTYSFEVIELQEVKSRKFDLILNGAGVCDPKVITESPKLLIDSHLDVDNLVMENLQKYPKTFFLNISSGAIYGKDFSNPAPKEIETKAPDSLELISGDASTMYAQTKLFFENKHRALKEFNIVDVRLFSIFHRHLDTESHYFMSQLIKALKNKETFVTSTDELTRDFIHPMDIINLAVKLCSIEKLNCAIDLRSGAPVKKSEILDYFVAKFQLDIEYRKMQFSGTKSHYYSTSEELLDLGVKLFGSSLECIAEEMRYIELN